MTVRISKTPGRTRIEMRPDSIPVADLQAKHVPSPNGVNVARGIMFALLFSAIPAALIVVFHLYVNGRV